MTIAITIIHDKTDAQNEAQIYALLNLVEEVVDGPFTDSDTGETWTTVHHQFKALHFPHRVRFYQVIPYGVTPPPSRYLINSGGIVNYGPDDAQRGETRFFNWGLKRGIDQGADISIYLKDPAALTALKLRNAVAKLKESTGLIETAWGRVATRRLLREIGQLDEGRTFSRAISDLKSRITDRGLTNE